MINKIINFLLLCLLLPKLLIQLGLFASQYAQLKLKNRKEITPILFLVLLSIWLINWQLWQKLQEPLTKLTQAPSQNSGEILFSLDKQELEALKGFYLELEERQQYSRDILFNLAKIFELEDASLAQEKFRQSWDLDPNYTLEAEL